MGACLQNRPFARPGTLVGERQRIPKRPARLPAAALSVAYLAIEVLLIPKAGQRWLVVGLLGAFHGLYFGLFLDAGVESRTGFLGGVVLGELFSVALLLGARWGWPDCSHRSELSGS